MAEIHDSVKHFKFHVFNMGIILITEIKVSTNFFQGDSGTLHVIWQVYCSQVV